MGKETEMEFTKEMVADLFVGQGVIDRKKRELKQFIPMINGLLREVSVRRDGRRWFDLPESVILVPVRAWALKLKWRQSGDFPKDPDYEQFLAIEFVGEPFRVEELEFSDLLEMHAALSDILNALLRYADTWPDRVQGLEQKLQVFLDQAKEA